MVYTVTFNPALDYVMNVEKLSTDDINRTESEELYYGGKGINVCTGYFYENFTIAKNYIYHGTVYGKNGTGGTAA